MTEQERDIMAALDRLATGFNAHDTDKIMSFFADDYSPDLPRGSEPHGSRFVGRDAVGRGINSRFEATPAVH